MTEDIDAHWSQALGVPISALHEPGVVVTAHAALRGYHGVWFFVRDRSAVVSAPPEWVSRLEQTCGCAAAEDLLTPAGAQRALGDAGGQVIGPSLQGWLAAGRFRPVASDGVRRVPEPESAVVERMRAACPSSDWEHGGIEGGATGVWASFHGDDPAALGRLRPHSGGAVDPCVVTHPAFRQRGHALRVVSAMTEEALERGCVVLYQTLWSNRPAVALASRLGFVEYASVLAVRLRVDVA